MSTHNIKIFNQSGFTKDYVVFAQPPHVTSESCDVYVYANTWVSFAGVTSGGFSHLSYKDDVSAFWRCTAVALSPNVQIEQGCVATVDPASCDGVTFSGTNSGAVGFDTSTPKPASTDSFQIKALADLTVQNHYVFGMAKDDGSGVAAPVVVFTAIRNTIFDIIPAVKFYVGDDSYIAGEIIYVNAFSNDPVLIDFTGRPQNTAIATQAPHGLWTVKYF